MSPRVFVHCRAAQGDANGHVSGMSARDGGVVRRSCRSKSGRLAPSSIGAGDAR
jgi:hypothetical protein